MNSLTMTRRKKEATPNRQLAQAILDQYQPKSVEDMQDVLKDIFGPMFEAMLQGEMNSHLGYSNNERGEKGTANQRNGYTKKTLKTTVGDVPIEVPRDREGTFEPVPPASGMVPSAGSDPVHMSGRHRVSVRLAKPFP